MGKDILYQDILQNWAKWYDNLGVEDILPTAYEDRHLEEFEIYSKYLTEDAKILEAGCGLGNQVIFLRRKGLKVVGVDYAEDALKKVKSFDASMCLSAADIHSLPFRSHSFYAYLSFGVLEHFPFGPMPALKEANRVLAKDGIIVLSMPGSYLLSRIVSGQADNFFSSFRNNRTLHKIFRKKESNAPIFALTYSKEQIADFLEMAGFSILTIRPTGHDFIWYTLIPQFRKNKLGIIKPVGVTFARFVKRFFPWRTSFYTFAVARKVKDLA